MQRVVSLQAFKLTTNWTIYVIGIICEIESSFFKNKKEAEFHHHALLVPDEFILQLNDVLNMYNLVVENGKVPFMAFVQMLLFEAPNLRPCCEDISAK